MSRSTFIATREALLKPLIASLDSTDPASKQDLPVILSAIAKSGSMEKVLEALGEALKSPKTRGLASRTLSRLLPRSADLLIACLDSDDEQLRMLAYRQLLNVGDIIYGRFLSFLAKPESMTKEKRELLSRPALRRPKHRALLVGQLGDESRAEACKSVLGPIIDQCLTEIRSAATSSLPGRRKHAVSLLLSRSPLERISIDLLCGLLGDPKELLETRQSILAKLPVMLGHKDPAVHSYVFATLLLCREAPEAEFAEAAEALLAKILQERKEAVRWLEGLALHPRYAKQARVLLGKEGRALPDIPLTDLVMPGQEEAALAEPSQRAAALRCLSARKLQALPDILRCLASEKLSVRYAAVGLLKKLDAKLVHEALKAAELRPERVLWALGVLGLVNEEEHERLIAGVSDPDPKVRGASLWALAEKAPNDEKLIPLLKKAAKDESVALRLTMIFASRKLGRRAFAVKPELEAMAKDPDPDVRKHGAALLAEWESSKDKKEGLGSSTGR